MNYLRTHTNCETPRNSVGFNWPITTHQRSWITQKNCELSALSPSNSKVRGTKIIFDGKAYAHKDMEALPHNLSMEKAKIVEVEDGIAFQGSMLFFLIITHVP